MTKIKVFPDHELIQLKSGLFVYTIGNSPHVYDGKETFLGKPMYTPDPNGTKIREGINYRKRLWPFKGDKHDNFWDFLEDYDKSINAKNPLIYMAVAFEVSSIAQVFNPIQKMEELVTIEKYNESLAVISSLVGKESVGVTGSLLAGFDNPGDIDLMLFQNAIAKLADVSTILMSKYGFQKLSDEKISEDAKLIGKYISAFEKTTLEKILKRKSKTQFLKNGEKIEFTYRYEFPEPPITNNYQLINSEFLLENAIISEEIHPYFIPCFYMTDKIPILSYNRLMLGALNTGDIVTCKGKLIEIESYGKNIKAVVIDDKDYLRIH